MAYFADQSHGNHPEGGSGSAFEIRPSTAEDLAMIIFVKILFVALAVLGQAKLFPEKPASAPIESSLDSLYLPIDNPERVLAKRAMEAQGLCAAEPARFDAAGLDTMALQETVAKDTAQDLASHCF